MSQNIFRPHSWFYWRDWIFLIFGSGPVDLPALYLTIIGKKTSKFSKGNTYSFTSMSLPAEGEQPQLYHLRGDVPRTWEGHSTRRGSGFRRWRQPHHAPAPVRGPGALYWLRHLRKPLPIERAGCYPSLYPHRPGCQPTLVRWIVYLPQRSSGNQIGDPRWEMAIPANVGVIK